MNSTNRALHGRYAKQLTDPRWDDLRKRFLSGKRCHECGRPDSLTVHHICYFVGKKAWEYEDQDLMPLCWPCHKERERAEEVLLMNVMRSSKHLRCDELMRTASRVFTRGLT